MVVSRTVPEVLAILVDRYVGGADIHPKLLGFKAENSLLADDSWFLRASRLAFSVVTQMLP